MGIDKWIDGLSTMYPLAIAMEAYAAIKEVCGKASPHVAVFDRYASTHDALGRMLRK